MQKNMVIDKKISDESREPRIDELIGQMIDDKMDDKMRIQYDELFEHVKNYLKEKWKILNEKYLKTTYYRTFFIRTQEQNSL